MPAVSAITAIAALGYSVYSGERQADVAQQNLRLQERAQQDADKAATADARRAAEAEKKAAQRTPDLNVLLAGEKRPAGPTSIDTDRLLLGRSSLLGS